MLPKKLSDALDRYSREYTDFEVIHSNDAIITSDWEIPDLDPRMLLLVRAFHQKFKIKTHILMGDVLATDQEALSHWPSLWKDEDVPEMSYKSGVALTVGLIEFVMDGITKLVIARGNHDDRVARATKGQVHLGMFLEMAGLPYSQYSYAFLETSRGPVKMIHPASYSKDSLKLAQELYNVTTTDDGRKAHIVIAHTHQAQSGGSPDKLRECHALGCLRHPYRTQYLRTNTSKLPPWDQGFLMIKDGHFYPIVIGRTDLSHFLPREMIPSGL